MTDFRDPDARLRTSGRLNDPDPIPPVDDPMARPQSSTMWGWLGGIALVVIVLALIFGFAGSGTRTADPTAPTRPVTTGIAPSVTNATPPAVTGERTTPPATAPSTTGQAPAR